MGTQLSLPKGAQPPIFGPAVCCGQTARWIKVPLGGEVGLGAGHIMLDGDHLPLPKGTQRPNFWPMSIVAKRLPISATAEHFVSSVILFVCESNISRTAGRVCAIFTGKTCLVPRSDEFECQGQRSRSPGTNFLTLRKCIVTCTLQITSCSSMALFAAWSCWECTARLMSVQTSLALVYCGLLEYG